MALATTDRLYQYNGNGVTTVFSFPRKFNSNSHLTVTLTSSAGVDTVKTITTHYTVTGAGSGSGGDVTMLTAPATGEKLTIERIVPLTQEIDYNANDNFPAETHEGALDLAVMRDQQIQNNIDLAIKFPSTETVGYDSVLPAKVDRTNKVIYFDASGNLSVSSFTTLAASLAVGNGLNSDGTTLRAAIPLWITLTAYIVGDVIRFTDEKIYRCATAHTSGTFATDLAAVKWVELSSSVTSETVTAKTTAYTVLSADDGKTFSNEGASAIVDFTLPTAVAGLRYRFLVQDVDGIKVIAAAGDTIRLGNTVSKVAGYIRSVTIGGAVEIVAINATEWFAKYVLEAWYVETS